MHTHTHTLVFSKKFIFLWPALNKWHPWYRRAKKKKKWQSWVIKSNDEHPHKTSCECVISRKWFEHFQNVHGTWTKFDRRSEKSVWERKIWIGRLWHSMHSNRPLTLHYLSMCVTCDAFDQLRRIEDSLYSRNCMFRKKRKHECMSYASVRSWSTGKGELHYDIITFLSFKRIKLKRK